ncbi:MAG: DUF3179 domain-containing protein, partial [Anaerolineae bacterium]|nr:DUF3179 domain-containing protein [Anaerolineae bacterium]
LLSGRLRLSGLLEGLGGREPRFTVRYTSVDETATYLPSEQQVIVVNINGDVRAYPLLLLNNHEIVNTSIDGVPIAVTFCPLCNASIVFERQVGGRELHFGVSGLLRNSDLIMFDHETESWWQQFLGEAIVGEYLGTQLTFVPSLVVSFGELQANFPEARVLANQAGHSPDRVSYAGYDERGVPFLFEGEIDPRLFPTERVLAIFGAQEAVAYPFGSLAEVGVVNDVFAGGPVVVLWQPGAASLFTPDLLTGSAGLFSRQLADGTELTFERAEDGTLRDTTTGSLWNVFGQATEGELAGTQLELLNAHPHFWFAWAAFQPETRVWQPPATGDS